jgi:organic hydroperoxide reductase OsmC/OhrA
MSDRDVHERPAPESAPAAVHTARISWLTDPPHGHATVSVGSRAIAAVPMSGEAAASEGRVTNPGELMAAAQGSAVAVMLAQILVRDGTPAHELVVATTYTFAGEWFEATGLELYVEGRVPATDPSRFERATCEAVDRCTASFGGPAHPKLRLTTRLQ